MTTLLTRAAWLGAMAAGLALGMALSFRVALADEMKMLSVDEMQAQIVGNSLTGKTESGDEYAEHYQPDGAIKGMSKESGAYEGKWSFRQDGLMCFKYGDGAFDGGCVHLMRDGDRVGFQRVDGSLEPEATLVPGMAPQLK